MGIENNIDEGLTECFLENARYFRNFLNGIVYPGLIFGNPDEVRKTINDIMQESYSRIYIRGGTRVYGRDPEVLRKIFFKTARNLVFDELKKRKKKQFVQIREDREKGESYDGSVQLSSEPDILETIECNELLSLVSSVQEPYRSAFLLRAKGADYDQISDELGIPIGTVKSRINRARKIFANHPAIREAYSEYLTSNLSKDVFIIK